VYLNLYVLIANSFTDVVSNTFLIFLIFCSTENCPPVELHKSECKAVPLQAWGDPEVSRNLRFPDFMTTAQDGDKVVSLTHRPPLPPGNTPGTHFWQRLS